MTDLSTPEEKTLQAQVDLYSNMLEHCSDLIHRVTPEGRFIYVNKAWREVLGYSEEDIKTLSLMDIVDDSCRGKCQGIFNALIGGEQIDNNETVFLTREGKKITVEGRCQTTFKDGKPIAMTGIFRDISDRIKNDIALKESDQRFRTLFENSSDIMQIVSTEGRFLHVNPAWLKTFGYDQDEIKNMTIFDLISPDCQEHCTETFQKVLSKVGVYPIDTTFMAKNHKKIEIEGNATAVFKDGKPVHSQCIFRDVTTKRKMEEELLKTQKLESIGVFAGGIAHDFNNLLTAILGNISLVRTMTSTEAPLAARLEKIETATVRAKGLTQQLLTFAKGGEPIKKLSGIADMVKDSIEFPLHGSSIKRDYQFAPELWVAEVDINQLSQVVQNLAINARQAMTDGGCMTVTGKNITLADDNTTGLQPGRYLFLTFSDEGHGISQQDQKRIFDPYFSSKEKGSGLGLAVAYSIMKKHDGLLTVDSILGVGTTFSIYLPAAPDQQHQEIGLEDQRPSLGGNILIMDDEEIVREVAGEMLNFLDYTSSAATDGEQALVLYQEAMEEGKPFDAVLMDLTIPGGMGGKETMTMLLEIDPHAQGIASSGYANDPIMAHFQDYGFSAIVPKPYKLDELRTTLNTIRRKN